jgi:hypothetical protein
MEGAAFIAEGDLNGHGGLEIGMFYLRKVFSVQKDRLVLTERIKQLYVTMGYRHWFTKKFSLAAAFFSSYSMGDPEVVVSEFPGSQDRPKTSAHDTTEYGFDFSIQHEFWHKGRFSAIVDGRYSLSVTAKPGEDANHYGAMIALKYFVQSRERSAEDEPEPASADQTLKQ